jgi:hypothetical protein
MAVSTVQITNVIKALGAVVGAYCVGKGWIPVGVWNDLLAGILLLATAGLTWAGNSTAAVISAAAAQPEVVKILTTEDVPKKLLGLAKIEARPAKFWVG